jgi:hypothetical protein
MGSNLTTIDPYILALLAQAAARFLRRPDGDVLARLLFSRNAASVHAEHLKLRL